jgi:hypothetical protein
VVLLSFEVIALVLRDGWDQAYRCVNAAPLLYLSHKSNSEITKENAMTQNAWKCVVAASLVSAWTLASVPLVAQSLSSVTQPVQVVNTPNVNVVNTSSVNVANTPTVSLAGGASVNVINPLDGGGNPTPLAVLEAVQPYEDSCVINFGGTASGYCNLQAIPSGKRLVIQEFDASAEIETGLKPLELALFTSAVYHDFTVTFMGNDVGFYDFFSTHQETRLYVAPSQTPRFFVYLSGNTNQGYHCAISGFLVDVPLGSSGAVAPAQPHGVPALPNRPSPVPGRQ